jgi:hypothetical protein
VWYLSSSGGASAFAGSSIFRNVASASRHSGRSCTWNSSSECGRNVGYDGIVLRSSTGDSPSALRMLETRVRWSISSSTTSWIAVAASRLVPSSIDQSAHRYGGIVDHSICTAVRR